MNKVEKIISKRFKKNGDVEYRFYSNGKYSWISIQKLNCTRMIQDFEREENALAIISKYIFYIHFLSKLCFNLIKKIIENIHLDAKKVDDKIFYLLKHKFGNELTEVSTEEAFSNWPNLIFKFLEESIVWAKISCASGRTDRSLKVFPESSPETISCKLRTVTYAYKPI